MTGAQTKTTLCVKAYGRTTPSCSTHNALEGIGCGPVPKAVGDTVARAAVNRGGVPGTKRARRAAPPDARQCAPDGPRLR
jgi:hypothetical protein